MGANDTATSSNDMQNALAEEVLPIRMVSSVVRGFGRGSSDLGIPTANLDLSALKVSTAQKNTSNVSFDDLPTGIYWGFCRIGERDTHDNGNATRGIVFPAAISLGYNPTYGNDTKTVEPHLIAPESDPRRHASSCGETVLQDFYDEPIRLSIVGYLRAELPFEGLDKLTNAIKKDISATVALAENDDEIMKKEKIWVASGEPVN